MKLKNIEITEVARAFAIINSARQHLKDQGIDQWQDGYPDYACIEMDAKRKVGYFMVVEEEIVGYICIDFDGEPDYNTIDGAWEKEEPFVVVHRMAMTDSARGKNISDRVLKAVEEMSIRKGVHYFRVDTDSGNLKMQHILQKNGFTYRGIITFDNTPKLAYDKSF